MQYRIEIATTVLRGCASGWGPALSNLGGYGAESSLTPERLSTFESAEVAFEKAKEIQKLRPLAPVRIVEAATGLEIWRLGTGDHEGEVFGPGPGAVYLNGEPADTTTLERKPQPIVVTHDPFGVFSPPKHPENLALLSAAAKRRRELAAGMPSVEVAEALGATPEEAADAFVADASRKFLNCIAPEVLESVRQIIAAQEEFAEAAAALRKRGSPPPVTRLTIADFEEDLAWADHAAQEILTNLRALAKKIGAD